LLWMKTSFRSIRVVTAICSENLGQNNNPEIMFSARFYRPICIAQQI
jgi:hypothetical protein